MDLRLAADIDAACRLSGQFELRSGQRSNEYFDKYLFEASPELLKRVSQAMVPLIPSDTDVLGGLELGGVPLATVVSQISGLPTLFVRKEAKQYGTGRLAEGADVAGRTVTRTHPGLWGRHNLMRRRTKRSRDRYPLAR